MYTVARYSKAAVQNPVVGKMYDAANDKTRWMTPDLSKFTAQAEVYTSSPWVNIAISLIAQTAALVNLNVYERKGEKKVGIENHPFELLMQKPNSHMSQFEFLYQLITIRRLTGNAYIYLVSANGGAPDEMLILRPDCVRIVPGSGGKRINGYVYDVSGADPIPLDPEQVVHWKRYHPTDSLYGLSDIQVIALSIQADKGMSTWQAKFFSRENAVPAGLVTVPPTMSNTDYEALKTNWYRNYGGTQRATAIIRGVDVKYQNIGTSHVDMDFQNGRLFEKEVILNKFGVPLSIFAVNANEANARAGLELLTSNVVWPEMVELAQKFTAELLPFWADNLLIEPDDIRVKDERAELQKLQAYAPYKTINEVRADLGYEPVDWGDLPAAGAAAAVPTIGAFAKPQLDQSQAQIEAGKSWLLGDGTDDTKALETDEQRKWFFANHPEYVNHSTFAGTPQFHPNETKAQHLEKFNGFVENEKHPIAQQLWQNDLVTYDGNANVVVQPDKVKAAARDFVVDSRDATLPRDYLTGMYAEQRGVGGSNQNKENRFNREKAAHAQAILMAAHVGDVPLTDAQRKHLNAAAEGKYLDNKYSQYASGDRGTLAPAPKDIRGKPSEYAAYMHGVHRNEFLQVLGRTKSAEIEAPRITRAAERELMQFVTYAGKRLWKADNVKGVQEVETFTFGKNVPVCYQILVRAYADWAHDSDELARMVDDLCNIAVKGISEPADRVSVAGRVDPLAREKSRLATKVATATGAYLHNVKRRILDHGEHEPTSGFWAGEQQTLKVTLESLLKNGLLEMTLALAAVASMDQDVTLDEVGLKSDIDGTVSHWGATTPSQITKTTRDGVASIYRRWRDQSDATADDLKSALDQSYMFSDARSEMIGETETTNAGAQCIRMTAQELANSLGVSFLNDDIAGAPAHGGCRCFETSYVVRDANGNATGVDRIWHTVNAPKVCDVCRPLNGKTFTEIADMGGTPEW